MDNHEFRLDIAKALSFFELTLYPYTSTKLQSMVVRPTTLFKKSCKARNITIYDIGEIVDSTFF